MKDLGRLSIEAFKSSAKTPVALILDNIRSGLNIGSVFRTADAFALEKLILCGITARPPHREILKTALGSTDSVDWLYYEQSVDAVEALRQSNWSIWAVEQTTGSVLLQDFVPQPGIRYAFILGNEVHGVDSALLPYCDGAVEIPQFGTKHSLNVAVAAGIVAWDLVKRIRLESSFT
ncbi:MAG: RNA methyltransferase [Saprospiraceae bacterium]|nr:RNA methyltransferase [Saprospiraceae bacterium]